MSSSWDDVPSDVDERIEGVHYDKYSFIIEYILNTLLLCAELKFISGEISQDNIDLIYNLINLLGDLSQNQIKDFVESLYHIATESFECCCDSECTSELKSSMKIMMYFLMNLCHKLEKTSNCQSNTEVSGKTGKGKTAKSSKVNVFMWIEWRALCLECIHKVLQADQSTIWSMGIVHENFLRLAWTYALELLENKPDGISGTGKVETGTRRVCTGVLALSMRQLELSTASSVGAGVTSFVAALIESICRHEHMGSVIAELCANARTGSVVCAELMNEVGGMNMLELSRGGAGVKHLGTFLTSLAESSPEVITLYLPLIMNHIDSDVYQIR